VAISRDFFSRPAVEVAPELLGCVLEHETAEGLVAVEITEVEAYAGQTDPASHAYRGKTQRNAVMFGPPGHAYVYFTYGMHFCVNLVCLGQDSVSAVLLRAGAIVAGEDLARARRTRYRSAADGAGVAFRDLARGPARLCQALDIDRSLDGADVCADGSPLRVRSPRVGYQGPGASTTARSGAVPFQGDDPPGTPRYEASLREAKIVSGPRVGVSRAAEVPWRFWFEGEPTVSQYRPHVARRRAPGSSPRD
jgi:DNA-3-methyladenine glycosylase